MGPRRRGPEPKKSSRMVHAHHSPLFAILSIVIAVLGSWTALDLFDRVSGNFGRARAGWLVAAALAMGLSIWSMHFVAMLGFDPGSAVSYDPILTLVSLALAIGATGTAFKVAASERSDRRHVVGAAVLMGTGICAMHYVGMAALRTAAVLGYDPLLVLLSLAVAVSSSMAALFVARSEQRGWSRAAAAGILGLAIVGMHYTAMAALHLTPVPGAAIGMPGPPPYPLAFGVAGTTVLILFLALMASLHDQRVNILAALDAGGVGYWELDLANWRLHLSPRGKAILGSAVDGAPVYADLLDEISPGSRSEVVARLHEAIDTGADYDVEYPLVRGDRWLNARGRVVGDGRHRPTRMVGVVIDVTDRRQAMDRIVSSERRQRLLVDELNHRVKNTLATVQSLSRQTARSAASVEGFHRSFEGRLLALSSAHNVLTQHGWEHAGLREILERELSRIAPDRVALNGEDVTLSVRQALAIGMAMHELVSNAVRHGALGADGGTVDVSWGLAASARAPGLVLEWRETPVADAAVAMSGGFGFQIIRRSIEGELEGEATLVVGPEGLVWRFVLPLSDHAGPAAGDGGAAAPDAAQ